MPRYPLGCLQLYLYCTVLCSNRSPTQTQTELDNCPLAVFLNFCFCPSRPPRPLGAALSTIRHSPHLGPFCTQLPLVTIWDKNLLDCSATLADGHRYPLLKTTHPLRHHQHRRQRALLPSRHHDSTDYQHTSTHNRHHDASAIASAVVLALRVNAYERPCPLSHRQPGFPEVPRRSICRCGPDGPAQCRARRGLRVSAPNDRVEGFNSTPQWLTSCLLLPAMNPSLPISHCCRTWQPAPSQV